MKKSKLRVPVKNEFQYTRWYNSPRWSGEITDCSMPMTFDQYDQCSGNCLYCFSWFQKSLKQFNPQFRNEASNYQGMELRSVRPEAIKKMFALKYEEGKALGQFNDYIRKKLTMQWGGLADPFDMYERKHGVGLELLRELVDYPICFSTKFDWWTKDHRYVELFKDNPNWNVKVSIINMDTAKAKIIEPGLPFPEKRLDAIERIHQMNCGGVTLRLRPFIIGLSDVDNEYLELIDEAYQAGAEALSTEFLCLEQRANKTAKERFKKISDVLGFDLVEYYRKYSPKQAGYLRLNYQIKKRYVLAMEKLCKELGMRMYVSDAHWKDKCENGSCCGLNNDWNYQRGQYTEMLVLAKSRDTGEVNWRDDMAPHLEMFKKFPWRLSAGFNTIGTKKRMKYWNLTMFDYLHDIWNDPKNGKSPYKYFHGLLKPIRKDKHGDLVYKYIPYK